jgi:hypothetical protein
MENKKDKPNEYVFWSSDPSILYKNKKYLEFVPTTKMTRVEQLNSITRFLMYLTILEIMTNKPLQWIQISIVLILFIVFIYYVFSNDKVGLQKELFKNYNINSNEIENVKDVDIESGYYDSSGKLHVGSYVDENYKKAKQKLTLEQHEAYKNATCKLPTVDNPYMNVTSNELQSDSVPESCNISDKIQKKINRSFNDGLFRDVSDVFGRENSQRQYFVMPNIYPPDQEAFANWLYGGYKTCKNDSDYCLKYEDVRYHR